MNRLFVLLSALSLSANAPSGEPDTSHIKEDASFIVEGTDHYIQKFCAVKTLQYMFREDAKNPKADMSNNDDGTHTVSLTWSFNDVENKVSVNYNENILVDANHQISPQNIIIQLKDKDGETASVTNKDSFTSTMKDSQSEKIVQTNLMTAHANAVSFQQQCIAIELYNRQEQAPEPTTFHALTLV